MRSAAFLAALVVLAQAGAAIALLVAGSTLAGALLAVGAAATVFCVVRISRSLRRTSRPVSEYSETEQAFW